MGNATYTLGDTPAIQIRHCEGDLEIEGRPEEAVTVEADSMPHSVQRDGELLIEECDDDMRVRAPLGARVSVDEVEGDVRIRRLAELALGSVNGNLDVTAIGEKCAVGQVEGDARFRETGDLALGAVNGDLDVAAISGRSEIGQVEGDMRARDLLDLALGEVSGDLDAEGISGSLKLDRVEGDARLRGTFGGFGPTHISGDLSLETSFTPGDTYEIAVEGDASVSVPDESNLSLHARVEGDVNGLAASDGSGGFTQVWGDGSARLDLTVNGDLSVRSAGPVFRGAALPTARVPEPSAAPPPPAAPDIAAGFEPAPPFGAAVDAEPAQPDERADPTLAVLEAVARGEMSPEEADNLLGR